MEQKIFSCVESRIKNNTDYYSRFYLGPFSHNKIITYSNTLRRALLSDLTNINVIAVNFFGIKHEYSTLYGVKESVLDILLNIKQLAFRSNKYLTKTISYFAYIRKKGESVVKGNDIILPNILQCVNHNNYVATVSNDGELMMKLLLSNNSEYSVSNSINNDFDSLLEYQTNYLLTNTTFPLIIDSNFSSVTKVNYTINQKDGLERFMDYLLLEIWTNGSVLPNLALQNAIKTVIELFLVYYDLSSTFSVLNYPNSLLNEFLLSKLNKTSFIKRNFLNQDVVIHNISNENENFLIDNLNIPLQLKFLLKRQNIFTLTDIINIKKSYLMEYCNISKKSMNDLQKSLLLYNIYLKD